MRILFLIKYTIHFLGMFISICLFFFFKSLVQVKCQNIYKNYFKFLSEDIVNPLDI